MVSSPRGDSSQLGVLQLCVLCRLQLVVTNSRFGSRTMAGHWLAASMSGMTVGVVFEFNPPASCEHQANVI